MNTLTILSGADIGGSCYLLELYGTRILFDCGVRVGSAYTAHPDIPSPETIDAIFVSHAHLDHMGAIAYMAAVCKNAKIYMTELTKEFVRYQLAATIAEYIGADTTDLQFHNRILCELIMNRIETIPYKKGIEFQTQGGKNCGFILYPAGHMPGAAMVYVHIEGKKILYTGDFAANYTSLTYPYRLPENIAKPDILILCGTHANNSEYEVFNQNALSRMEQRMYDAVSRSYRLIFPIDQLTKGLEVLATLEDMISKGTFPASQIYVEPNLRALSQYYERASETFRLPEYIRPLAQLSQSQRGWGDVYRNDKPVIVFEHTGYDTAQYANYTIVEPDFTLHADYLDLIDLICAVKPEQVFVVHAGTGKKTLHRETLNENLKHITYTENNTVYELL